MTSSPAALVNCRSLQRSAREQFLDATYPRSGSGSREVFSRKELRKEDVNASSIEALGADRSTILEKRYVDSQWVGTYDAVCVV